MKVNPKIIASLLISLVFGSPIYSLDSDQYLLQASDNSKPIKEGVVWLEDFYIAQNISSEQQKPLFVLFTGSDWCQNCQILEENILRRSSFIDNVKERFVFVKVDFPLKKKLSQEIVSKNQKLKEQFQINGFPTVVICLPSGEKLFFAGRFPLEPKECADLFINELEKAYDLDTSLKKLEENKHNLTLINLENLYKKAQLFGKNDEAELILKIGIEKEGDNSFFLQEKYRQLVDAGQIDDQQAKEVRQQLCYKDKDNLKGHKLYIAVCDFQSLSKTSDDTQKVSAPLRDYLKEFGSTDAENNWRVELMLAHYHTSKKEKERALQYLKLALKDAPLFLKKDIESNVAKLENQ